MPSLPSHGSGQRRWIELQRKIHRRQTGHRRRRKSRDLRAAARSQTKKTRLRFGQGREKRHGCVGYGPGPVRHHVSQPATVVSIGKSAKATGRTSFDALAISSVLESPHAFGTQGPEVRILSLRPLLSRSIHRQPHQEPLRYDVPQGFIPACRRGAC